MIICLFTMFLISYVQINGQKEIDKNASYFDPITIDFLAFLLSGFLIIEGIYRIIEHRDAHVSRQFTRSIRVAIGFGVLTTHIIQALFKFYN